MLEQPDGLTLDELIDHVAEDSSDGVEPLVRLTNISEPEIVEEDLLHNEDGDGLAEF